MRVVDVRQLHERTGALVDFVAGGNTVVIVRRGRRVAELRPAPASEGRAVLPDRTALLAKFPRLKGDSGRFLEADRQ